MPVNKELSTHARITQTGAVAIDAEFWLRAKEEQLENQVISRIRSEVADEDVLVEMELEKLNPDTQLPYTNTGRHSSGFGEFLQRDIEDRGTNRQI